MQSHIKTSSIIFHLIGAFRSPEPLEHRLVLLRLVISISIVSSSLESCQGLIPITTKLSIRKIEEGTLVLSPEFRVGFAYSVIQAFLKCKLKNGKVNCGKSF